MSRVQQGEHGIHIKQVPHALLLEQSGDDLRCDLARPVAHREKADPVARAPRRGRRKRVDVAG